MKQNWKRFTRTYAYVRRHRYGKWLLALTWFGITLALVGTGIPLLKVFAYVPLWLERRELIEACWAPLPETQRPVHTMGADGWTSRRATRTA